MTPRPLRLPALSLVSLVSIAWWSAPVWAGDVAHEWLVKMTRAARNLDYEGTFVFQRNSRLETMRVVHKVVDGVPQERLLSLTGAPREIVRDAKEVRCYYPDDNAVMVEQRRIKVDGQNFPTILPERLQDLDDNYIIELGRSGRVAERAAQQVLIRPRDGYRYGYHLWGDRKSGLMLKADLVDEKNRMLEQFMFTQIIIGGPIPATALTPQLARPGMTWHRDNGEPTLNAQATWIATRLPKGFRLSTQIKREVPLPRKPVEHLVYSDGLAAVSIFVEKLETEGNAIVRGENQMGAVNAYGADVDGYHVTAIGEVPAATVLLIGGSVSRRP